MQANPFFVDDVSQLYAVRARPSSIGSQTVPAVAANQDDRPLPMISNAVELLEDSTIIQPPEIVKGVLHQGLKGLLGSSSKARKTWVLLDLAVSVATGTNWWKWETTQGRVLVVNFEIPKYFIRSRIEALKEAKGLQDLSLLDVWTLRGYSDRFDTLVPKMIEAVRSKRYSLIIIDPIYKGLGKMDENKAGDIGQLCNTLERLAVQTDAAVIYAHHYSKGNQSGKESIDRIGGSGVFARDADTIITLTKHDEENSFTVDLTLRNMPEQPSFVVQWTYPLMALRNDLDPKNLKNNSKNNRIYDENVLLNYLNEPMKLAEWQKEVTGNEGIPSKTFYRLKNKLISAGKVEEATKTRICRKLLTNQENTSNS